MINHICFCADGNYLNYVPSVIESIVLTNDMPVEFHIITDEPRTPLFDNILRKMSNPPTVNWHRISTDQFAGTKEVKHFTKAMYYRLMIPELIPAEKVLYLDCDVLVRASLMPLFQYQLNDYYIAAVDNPLFYRYESLGIDEKGGYFNSGVMLINTSKWKADSIKASVIDVVLNHAELLFLPDQDALNKVINGRWLRLDAKYNLQMSMLLRPKEIEHNVLGLADALASPAIVHFSATNKQWHRSCFVKYASEYKKLKTCIVIPKRNYLADILFKMLKRIQLRYIDGNLYV